MSNLPGKGRLVVFCECGNAEAVPAANLAAVSAVLADLSTPAVRIRDVCELAARGDAFLRKVSTDNDLIVIACHPRAVRWLLDMGGAPVAQQRVAFVNLHDAAAATRLRALLEEMPVVGLPDAEHPEAGSSEWPPWFPVIDYEHCANCRKCLNFCLFGVYEEEDGKVVVRHPEKCKNNCPACSRICPVQAIIFPKFNQPPYNGDAAPLAAPAEQGPATAALEGKRHRRRQLFGNTFSRRLADQDREPPAKDA